MLLFSIVLRHFDFFHDCQRITACEFTHILYLVLITHKFLGKLWMILMLTATWLKSRLDGPMDGLGVQQDLMRADWTHRISHDILLYRFCPTSHTHCWLVIECYFDRDILLKATQENPLHVESLVYKFASLSGSWFYCAWVLIRTQWLSAWVLINTLKNPWKCWRASGLQIVWTEWTLIG